MSENLRNYTKAVYGMDHVIRSMDQDLWEQPSPCEGWKRGRRLTTCDRRAALDRVVARGGAPESSGLGPAEEFAAARDGLLEALDHPHVLRKTVPTPFGELSIDDLIGIVVVDCTVHTWDIAMAVGGDTRIPPQLVAAAHTRLSQLDPVLLRSDGFFGAALPDAPGDDPQSRFLRFAGRQP